MDERGVVMGVLDKAFDVLVFRLGVIKRVYLDVSYIYVLFSGDYCNVCVNIPLCTEDIGFDSSCPSVRYSICVRISTRMFIRQILLWKMCIHIYLQCNIHCSVYP